MVICNNTDFNIINVIIDTISWTLTQLTHKILRECGIRPNGATKNIEE